ncbi:UNVERIFIED_CONTAM: hypothetical protein PYX00_003764 [Menopon gallinae]|uniref:Uncharacterized protein n=1 Tax=Menopon gallinae TaxID=328185 RepID=A0AAW2I182_9NEOP
MAGRRLSNNTVRHYAGRTGGLWCGTSQQVLINGNADAGLSLAMASPRKSRKTSLISSDGECGSCLSPCDLDEQDIENIDDARRVIRDLKEKCRNEAHQLLLCRRRAKIQEEKSAKREEDWADRLGALWSQLMLFEARLIRKQKDISSLLSQKDVLIARQQQALHLLQHRLAEAGIESPLPDISCFAADSPTGETNLDSLNDSDSAVVLEDGNDHDSTLPRFRSGSDSVTIVRSVSDAVEPGGKYYSMRRSNGYLRRPEILETVYSVEEDGDGDAVQAPADEKKEAKTESQSGGVTPVSTKRLSWSSSGRLQALYGSFERLNDSEPEKPEEQAPNHVTTYNRVMSNHRSVTKPKDVKYKRINKAKSKSLEELRGRLKNWVDKGGKNSAAYEHSEA